MSKMKCINPAELTASITAAANIIAKNLSEDELTLISAVLTQLSDTLNTIAVVRSLNREICEKEDDKTNKVQSENSKKTTEKNSAQTDKPAADKGKNATQRKPNSSRKQSSSASESAKTKKPSE